MMGIPYGVRLSRNPSAAPPDKFVLMMRMYSPNEEAPSIINGNRAPFASKRVS